MVLAAQDLVDGRSLSSMVTAPAAGAYLRDEIRFGDDGAAAFAAAVTRIEAGESGRSIVAAWARASEHDVEAVSRALFDPFFAGPLGIDELDVAAMRAQSWIRQAGRLRPCRRSKPPGRGRPGEPAGADLRRATTQRATR